MEGKIYSPVGRFAERAKLQKNSLFYAGRLSFTFLVPMLLTFQSTKLDTQLSVYRPS